MKFIFVAGGRGKGSVCIACQPCQIKTWLDGVAEVPPWVAELGSTVET